MPISQDEANQILILASNYAAQRVAAESFDNMREYEHASDMDNAADKTWLKLKALIDSLTDGKQDVH